MAHRHDRGAQQLPANSDQIQAVRLRIGFLNAHGRVRHDDGLRAVHGFATGKALHALALTETWTHGLPLSVDGSAYEHVRGAEQPRVVHGRHVLGMNALVTRRSGGAGAVAGADREWSWKHLNAAPFRSAHTQWLQFSTTQPDAEGGHTHVFVGSVYVPNKAGSSARARVWQRLRDTCDELRRGFERSADTNVIVIGGDFNGRTMANGDPKENAAGRELREFAGRNGFTIANTLPCARGELSFTGSAAATHAACNRHRSGAAAVRPKPKPKPRRRPRGSTNDYVLIDTEHSACVTGFSISDDGHGIGSDHKPLVLELLLQLTPLTACAADTAGAAAQRQRLQRTARPQKKSCALQHTRAATSSLRTATV